jgi:hypothetical protein
MPNIPDKPSYSHGSTGTEPGSSIDYANGDAVDQAEFDYFIYTPFNKIKAIIDFLDALDADGDGKVDAAEQADDATNVTSTYKSNDIDSDGDGQVDAADDATNVTSTYKGNDIDSDGDGKVNSAESADDATNVTSTYKSNDIDSDGDGKVDSAEQADNADTLDNYQPDEIVANNFVLPATAYSSGLTNVIVWRLNLQAGEQLEVRRVDVGLKGGGTDGNVALDLYDVTNNTNLVGDTTAGSVSVGKPIATSQSGATIVARLSNSSGAEQNVTATVKANIIE